MANSPTETGRMGHQNNKILRVAAALFLFTAIANAGIAQQWVMLGPDGGDARTITLDPHASDRLLLTTSSGVIFESRDGGQNWFRFAHLGGGDDYVLDDVIFHPKQRGLIYVAAWSVIKHSGDIFRSNDDGRTWNALPEMHGKSVRALALSLSNPQVLVAGALDGVYRSDDGGEHWNLISPVTHADIRNIESIAIDPLNLDIIYAGTWHLPWKTTDGGLTWKNIKRGVIDDSDVFSIIIDSNSRNVVYASACSGIYKSENGGELFRKVQGIPYSARRTRVLVQDPSNPEIVYAGTTEGLWKTRDAGITWRRMTAANVIINDVEVDPARPNRVLLATDRSGVLVSGDGGQTFMTSNRGFAHRQVAALLIDRIEPGKIYAGLLHDKEFGGVFVTADNGLNWQQMSSGLNGMDVLTLRQSPKGNLLAGTSKGLYIYSPVNNEYRWKPLQVVDSAEISPGKKTRTSTAYRGRLNSRINDLEIGMGKWFVATSTGLYASTDQGRTWHGGRVEEQTEFIALHIYGQQVAAVSPTAMVHSIDGGNTWRRAPLPSIITTISDVAIGDSGILYIATREGAYRSSDGVAWEHVRSLPVNNVATIYYDEPTARLIATSSTSTQVFESTDQGKSWNPMESGWTLHKVHPVGGSFIATTAFDGIVAPPTIDSATGFTGGAGTR